MNRNFSLRLVLIAGIVFVFTAGASSLVYAQARRQPPASDQKKNKRPPEGQTDEQKQERKPSEDVLLECATRVIAEPGSGDGAND